MVNAVEVWMIAFEVHVIHSSQNLCSALRTVYILMYAIRIITVLNNALSFNFQTSHTDFVCFCALRLPGFVDWDGDELVDVVRYEYGGLYIYYQRTDGTFDSAPFLDIPTSEIWAFPVFVDFDMDGDQVRRAVEIAVEK